MHKMLIHSSQVGMDWPWFGQYGNKLLKELKKLDVVPPMQPKPQHKKTEKWTVHELEEEYLQQDQLEPVKMKKKKMRSEASHTHPKPDFHSCHSQSRTATVKLHMSHRSLYEGKKLKRGKSKKLE